MMRFKKYLYSVFKKIKDWFLFPVHHRMLDELFVQGVPKELHVVFMFLLTKHFPDKETKTVCDRIEAIRKGLENSGGDTTILYSPKPIDCPDAIKFKYEDFRPEHGDKKLFTLQQIAKTGKNWYWGTFLYLCAKAFKSKVSLELGSCAGISACYLASNPWAQKVITIEGAPGLATIAKENLRKINRRAIVVNALFDDALDQILPDMSGPIDFCFIDGHHEKNATIHYFKRIEKYLSSGCIVVFDDIRWSQDMLNAWQHISNFSSFSHTFDLGAMGLCIIGESLNQRHWDLQPILGKAKVSYPHGWIKQEKIFL